MLSNRSAPQGLFRGASTSARHASKPLAHCALPPTRDSPQPSTSLPSVHEPLNLARVVTVATSAIIISTLVVGVGAARAEEREWKPRRHYRRLEERFTDKWAEELVQEQEKEVDRKVESKRRQEQLRREQEQAESAKRRQEEAARRARAEEILAKQAASGKTGNELPFSIKIGGQEMAPVIVWGGLGLLGLSALLKALSTGSKKAAQPAGKWVYDRSLGGKRVWVAADGTGGASAERPAISDADLGKLTSIAAAAASASRAEPAAAFVTPSWWHPSPRNFAEPALKAARQNDADRVLARLEGQKLKGDDYSLQDIAKLREICQEGGVSVKPRTVGSRDALFRSAVDAAVAASVDPAEAVLDTGDASPTRFLSSLAVDLGVPEDKAVAVVAAQAATAARARLVDALAGVKEDAREVAEGAVRQGETFAVMSLIRLSSLLEKMPVLLPGSKEVALIAESLQSSFGVEERKRAFYLLGQLYPEAAALAAELLGFDPALVVPQLMADMEAYRRQAEQAAAQAASSGKQ